MDTIIIYCVKFVFWWANKFKACAYWWERRCQDIALWLRKRISRKQEAMRVEASIIESNVAAGHVRIEKAAEAAKRKATVAANVAAARKREKAKAMDDKYNSCIL